MAETKPKENGSKKEVGFRRSNCDFLHVTLACNDGNKNAHKETKYKCEGCKSVFPRDNYVVRHAIHNMELWFCLNWDDFIKDKSKVWNNDWTLFDQMEISEEVFEKEHKAKDKGT